MISDVSLLAAFLVGLLGGVHCVGMCGGIVGALSLGLPEAQRSGSQRWIYLLAYNIIRLLMAQAALLADILPRQISFKHTLQLWIAWRQSAVGLYDDDELACLFILIAQQQVGNRPGRIEPRAVKRRPKPFPLLTKPRETARRDVRIYGHPKKLK